MPPGKGVETMKYEYDRKAMLAARLLRGGLTKKESQRLLRRLSRGTVRFRPDMNGCGVCLVNWPLANSQHGTRKAAREFNDRGW